MNVFENGVCSLCLNLLSRETLHIFKNKKQFLSSQIIQANFLYVRFPSGHRRAWLSTTSYHYQFFSLRLPLPFYHSFTKACQISEPLPFSIFKMQHILNLPSPPYSLRDQRNFSCLFLNLSFTFL